MKGNRKGGEDGAIKGMHNVYFPFVSCMPKLKKTFLARNRNEKSEVH